MINSVGRPRSAEKKLPTRKFIDGKQEIIIYGLLTLSYLGLLPDDIISGCKTLKANLAH